MVGSGRFRAATSDSRSSGALGPEAPKAAGKRAEAARGPPVRVASIISEMGVMPAMVSFEKGKP